MPHDHAHTLLGQPGNACGDAAADLPDATCATRTPCTHTGAHASCSPGVAVAAAPCCASASACAASEPDTCCTPASELPGPCRLVLALALALASETLGWVGSNTLAWHGAALALAAVAVALVGLGVLRTGWAALRSGRMTVAVLMAVAVLGAFAIGRWAEAAMVMALYVLGEWIEARATARSGDAVATLLALAPSTCQVRQADGHWAEAATASVAVGSVLRVRAGERVPLDGAISAGHAALNEAALTGESLPVDKTVGDAVYAGSINGANPFELRSTALASASTLARIAATVREAQSRRAPIARRIDRLAAIYTPTALVLALAVALLGPLLAGWSWLHGVYQALALLVAACPCALLLASPMATASALAVAARSGVLIKGGAALERAHRLRAVALDKTGTLTSGQPRLVAWGALPGTDANTNADTVQSQASALAGASHHPVARAIHAGLPAANLPLQHAAETPGGGVSAEVGGAVLRLGRAAWALGAAAPHTSHAPHALPWAEHAAQGHSISVLAAVGPASGEQAPGERPSSAQTQAWFAVADPVRPQAARAVADLRQLGLAPLMLTGDHAASAHAVAAAVGIARTDVQAGLSPEAKLAALEAAQRQHGAVAMVGDGINDAPALARADFSVAMGASATDVARHSADVVVLGDDLSHLPATLRLARRAWAVLMQNLALALGLKAAFLAAAAAGHATLWLAVLADMGASLLVIGNGLRLGRGRL